MSDNTLNPAESKAEAIARYFEVDKFGSSITTEIIAGVTTFLSIAYIFIVSPAILSQAGIDPTAALFATAVTSSLATFAMGMWANLPFAVAPGLTMSSYFVFVVVQKMHFTWQQALSTVFVSGVLCVVLTALPLRQAIIDSIPDGLKRAITISIGTFVATIGLFISKILIFKPSGIIDGSALDAAHLLSPFAALMAFGLVVSLLLGHKRLNFPAGMMVAILMAAALYHVIIPEQDISAASSHSLSSFGQLDFSVFTHSQFLLPVIVFFVLDFFEGIGEFIGLTSNTTIQDKDGNVPNMKQALWIDGIGTTIGAFFGTSSLIVFVESAVGIKAGGRTGLTAVVCSLLMAVAGCAGFYAAPLLALVPAQAAAGVLVYVGYLIVSSAINYNESGNNMAFDRGVALVMAAVSLLTFSLDKSLAFGLWAYFAASFVPARASRPAWWLAVIAGALTAAIWLSA